MLHGLRRRSRALASAVLLGLVLSGAWAPMAHAADCPDAGCGIVVVAHDADAHRLRGAPPVESGHPLHCVLCHWTRTIRPVSELVHHLAPRGQDAARRVTDVFRAPLVFPAAQPPLRSPPPPPASV